MPSTPRPAHPFSGGRKMKPTQKHREAVWEGILGTVYAANAAGEVRYFDYDWDGARDFAGVRPEGDPRVWKSKGIRSGRPVLYVLRETKAAI